MNEEKEPLKVGRIPISVERALKLHLASNVSVYMSGESISALAEEKPASYLSIIEETSLILRTPDFVCFCKEEEAFLFLRLYNSKSGFRFVGVGVNHVGTPKRWAFSHIKVYGQEELSQINRRSEFVRP